MQWKLCRLAHGANEQAYAHHGHQHPLCSGKVKCRQCIGLGKHLDVVQRTGEGNNQTNTQDEPKVAHPVHQKSLHVGKNGSGLVKPKSDQQVRHQTYRFPAKEQLQQVVAHDQHQHGKSEQRNIGEEAVVAFVFLHVANCVEMDHQGHKGHHAHHHGGEAIHQKADLHLQRADRHPGVERFVEAGTVHHHRAQSHG